MTHIEYPSRATRPQTTTVGMRVTGLRSGSELSAILGRGRTRLPQRKSQKTVAMAASWLHASDVATSSSPKWLHRKLSSSGARRLRESPRASTRSSTTPLTVHPTKFQPWTSYTCPTVVSEWHTARCCCNAMLRVRVWENPGMTPTELLNVSWMRSALSCASGKPRVKADHPDGVDGAERHENEDGWSSANSKTSFERRSVHDGALLDGHVWQVRCPTCVGRSAAAQSGRNHHRDAPRTQHTTSKIRRTPTGFPMCASHLFSTRHSCTKHTGVAKMQRASAYAIIDKYKQHLTLLKTSMYTLPLHDAQVPQRGAGKQQDALQTFT